MTLEDHGFSVIMATDGEDGLKKASADDPHVIITDFVMPRMDGWSMISQLRAQGIDIPIIIASANIEDSFGNKDLYQGYIAKPYSEADLIGLLNQLLGEVDGLT